MREVTMSTTVLAQLLTGGPEADGVGSDPRAALSAWWDWVLLNPQPLPPREGYPPWPSSRPRYWTLVTRAVIGRHLDRLETAGIIIVGGDVEHVVRQTAHALSEFADALSGEPSASSLGPFAPAPNGAAPSPVDLVMAGLQFQHAADLQVASPLREVLERSAERLLETGLARAGRS